MTRPIAFVGAPSSIGIRPYDDGQARYLDRAPGVLRERGLIRRLGAIDLGDVTPPAYHDYVRPPNRARNEEEVLVYSRSLAARVATATANGQFALVLGGDCSIVLGCLLGAKTARDPLGLAYSLMTRSKRIDYETLKRRDPAFITAYESSGMKA